MTRSLLFLIAIPLVACSGGEKIASPPKPGDVVHLPPIEWHVVDREQLEQVYGPVPKGQKLEGFIGTVDGRTIIVTLPPTHVDDEVTTTLGHEVMHAALGGYHQ